VARLASAFQAALISSGVIPYHFDFLFLADLAAMVSASKGCLKFPIKLVTDIQSFSSSFFMLVYLWSCGVNLSIMGKSD
jgi:ABC-type uncharacterized transport system permease subunit